MLQSHDIEVAGDLFPFYTIEEVAIIREDILRVSKKNIDIMELPVNNYLKTNEEIEKEFQHRIDPGRDFIKKIENSVSDHDAVLGKMNTDHIITNDSGEALHGFMEENY